MELLDPIDFRDAEFAKFASSPGNLAALQEHANEIIRGPAFKGSHRSGQFLKYVIDQSIAGHFDLLKERLIGVELFGRSPSYDTGEDAIVRVTANEVRKRLLQHYGGSTTQSEYRLSLPQGSYIPSIARTSLHEVQPVQALNGAGGQHSPPDVEFSAGPSQSDSTPDIVERLPTIPVETIRAPAKPGHKWLVFFSFIVVLNVGLWLFFHYAKPSASAELLSHLPWSVLFESGNPTIVVTSDPNIAEIQGFTGDQISLSDYANHNYFSGPKQLTPEDEHFVHYVLRGDKASSVDVPIAVKAGQIAQSASRKIEVRGARDIQLSDLKTDANLIILGSPRSDPWSGLYSDQLDFRFVFNKDIGKEFVLNAHPHANERVSYVATAPGWATGQSYAIVAFLQNPDSNGHILLLAGASAEGTEAAGRLVTESTRLSQALQQCGLFQAHAVANFEMLLQLNTMAGSPSHEDVVACHILGSTH
jgi:hypothetical protein